ncbi:MAG: B12-binding domain-containing radical SAM protein [Planctomycetota bacterium]
MKILFIEPPPTLDWKPQSKITTAGRRHPSLNVTGEKVYSYLNLSSAAVARDKGHEVFYIHCQTEQMGLNELGQKVSEIEPDLLVIQLEHINISVACRAAQITKELTGCKVVFVGTLVTAIPKESLEKYSICDYVLRGEWDYTVSELADCLFDNDDTRMTNGLCRRNNGQIQINDKAPLVQDLDALPFPAYDLLDLSKFYESVFTHFPAATAITSRGCPFECVYCVFPNTIYSHKYRYQSPERVLAEAMYLQNEFGVKQIRYDDDTFEINKQRVFDICRLFTENDVKLKWIIQSRPSLMTEEMAKALKKAGCVMVLYGVESGDDEILKKIKKNTTTSEIERGVRIVKKYGLDVLNCVMIGFYWDSPETIKRTIDFAFKLNAEFTQFSIATPLPGTEYYELLKSSGYMVSDDLEKGDSFHKANVDFPNLKQHQIDRMLKGIYRRYYIRPRYLLIMLSRCLRSPANISQMFRLIKAYIIRYKENWL